MDRLPLFLLETLNSWHAVGNTEPLVVQSMLDVIEAFPFKLCKAGSKDLSTYQ